MCTVQSKTRDGLVRRQTTKRNPKNVHKQTKKFLEKPIFERLDGTKSMPGKHFLPTDRSDHKKQLSTPLPSSRMRIQIQRVRSESVWLRNGDVKLEIKGKEVVVGGNIHFSKHFQFTNENLENTFMLRGIVVCLVVIY